MKFIIDAGHGGRDPGAIGPTGLMEKDVTLDIGTRLAAIAMMRGHDPILTRRRDEYQSLKYRTDFANAQGGECFVSIHCNSFTTPIPYGFEIWTYRNGSLASSSLAQYLLVAWQHQFPGNGNRGHKKSGFHVLRETTMPAVLLEVDFISHPVWERWLRDGGNHQKMAEAIMAGIEAWGGKS